MVTYASRETDTIAASKPLTAVIHAAFFVFGFSLVFIVGWGGTATLAGNLFSEYKSLIGQVGGAIVILFGLHTLGILRLRWLDRDIRLHRRLKGRSQALSSVFMGVFFAAGWTPCIGTTLGAILTLGFHQETSGQAMFLASGYALGLGLPFLGLGFAVGRAATLLSRLRSYIRLIQIASGLLQIAIGLMLLTNSLYLIAIWAQRNGLFWDPGWVGGAGPTYLVAILAGLLSFLSPCVLPLVPAYLGYLSGRAVQA